MTPNALLSGRDILVLDDEALWRRRLVAFLERQGAEVVQAGTVAEARRAAAALPFDLALLDVNLPDGEGLDLLREGVFGGGTAVVVMTAEGGVERVVEAFRLGARDYLAKPFDPAELTIVFGRCLRGRRDERLQQHRASPPEAAEDEGFWFGGGLAPVRAQLDRLLETDRRLGTRLPPVLLCGETGTGKTSLARWIHRSGPRAAAPLVELNCGAVAEHLAESELFGHEKGAFTDAKSARIGLFEAADGGTLFLDELPSLSAATQAKLLKVLEDGRIRRVGGTKDIAVDVRVIAATNLDLVVAVREGRFRADLLHRLDLFRIDLPPLRARAGDLPALAGKLLEGLAHRYRLGAVTLGDEGLARLRGWSWPGNVRELAHELERAVILEGAGPLRLDRLGPATAAPSQAAPATAVAGAAPGDWLAAGWTPPEEGFQVEAAIDRFVDLALEASGGNVSEAARRLGATRDFVRYRLRQRGKA